MRDLASNLDVKQSLAPALQTATDEGSTVDTLGFESVTFAVHIGAWTDGTFVLSAEHSDDDSSWSAVTSAELIGTPPTVEDANGDNDTLAFGYIGNKRYVRPKVTVTGSPSTGAFIGVDVILGHPHERPVS